MDQLTLRQNEVRALRAGLAKGLQEVRGRLSPPELLEDALILLDPERRFLGRVQSGIKRNPLLAAIFLAGLGWLISDAAQKKRSRDGLNHRRRSKTTSKNTTNKGGYHDTQHHDRDQWPNASDGTKQASAHP